MLTVLIAATVGAWLWLCVARTDRALVVACIAATSTTLLLADHVGRASAESARHDCVTSDPSACDTVEGISLSRQQVQP